ncbi:DUF6458 family protein [Aeromicrobium duanguangcaii]|uniref:DUF6458 family protein n=1 Tax=Aeromicrobium duanguangcaii TaxID=2968086 RepID=A0ABY5KDX6_9ACTN|nr:DUF6458 family protein [Aeromicrobium duanguangcaii]MCD9154275.1 DUF6458 family protein [Aeromicrobium duanguangcaii]UUI68657.1 DUF6458 family protein [Aeromicrobium duanguangcaii]
MSSRQQMRTSPIRATVVRDKTACALARTVPKGRDPDMYFGGSIALIAIGAILAFAVQDTISGIDLTMIGYILMAAGALGIVLTLIVNSQRDRGVRDGGRDDLPPAR